MRHILNHMAEGRGNRLAVKFNCVGPLVQRRGTQRLLIEYPAKSRIRGALEYLDSRTLRQFCSTFRVIKFNRMSN
jgi:hypothetical protein